MARNISPPSATSCPLSHSNTRTNPARGGSYAQPPFVVSPVLSRPFPSHSTHNQRRPNRARSVISPGRALPCYWHRDPNLQCQSRDRSSHRLRDLNHTSAPISHGRSIARWPLSLYLREQLRTKNSILLVYQTDPNGVPQNPPIQTLNFGASVTNFVLDSRGSFAYAAQSKQNSLHQSLAEIRSFTVNPQTGLLVESPNPAPPIPQTGLAAPDSSTPADFLP